MPPVGVAACGRLLAFAATVSSRRAFAAVLLACALVAGGCGGGGDDEDKASQAAARGAARPVPARRGRTLAELRRDLPKGGPVLAPTVSRVRDREEPPRLRPVHDRAGADRRRACRGLHRPGRRRRGPGAVRGALPVARGEARVPERGRSADDPDAAKTLYVAEVPFKKPGKYEVLGMARLDDRLVAATSAMPQLVVVSKKDDPVPGAGRHPAGDPHADGGGRRPATWRRSTRACRPRPSMHEVDFADELGKKPIVLLFATPLLCQSRVCGPVVDIALQLAGQVPRPGRLHPHGDLQRQRGRQGHRARRSARSACRRSRGCSRSTSRARSPRASRAPSASTSWRPRRRR